MVSLGAAKEDNDRDGQKSILQRLKSWLAHLLWVVVFRKSEAFIFLFGWIAAILLFVQFIVFINHKPRDPETAHWKKAYLGGKIMSAPVFVYQHAKYRGFGMPVYANISDLRLHHVRDVSSIKVAKGVTVTLYSEVDYQGAEITVDHDVTYIGDRFNDQSYSLAMSIDPVEPHDVWVYRTGASLHLPPSQCPSRVECSPAATLSAVGGSVYMARNRMMLEHLSPQLGCTLSHFTRPDGQRIYGVLPGRVHGVCVDEQFVLPAEAPGHRLLVPNPSLHRRLQVETVVGGGPRVLRAEGVLSEAQRSALLSLARPLLAPDRKSVV